MFASRPLRLPITEWRTTRLPYNSLFCSRVTRRPATPGNAPRQTVFLLKTHLHDLAAPARAGVDLLIHQPCFGCAARIDGDRGIIAPALRCLIAETVKCRADNAHYATGRRYPSIGVAFAGEHHHGIAAVRGISRAPGNEGISGGVRGDGSVKIIGRVR